MNKQGLMTLIKHTRFTYIKILLFLASGFLIISPAFSKNKQATASKSKSVKKMFQRKISIGEPKVTKAPQKEVHE